MLDSLARLKWLVDSLNDKGGSWLEKEQICCFLLSLFLSDQERNSPLKEEFRKVNGLSVLWSLPLENRVLDVLCESFNNNHENKLFFQNEIGFKELTRRILEHDSLLTRFHLLCLFDLAFLNTRHSNFTLLFSPIVQPDFIHLDSYSQNQDEQIVNPKLNINTYSLLNNSFFNNSDLEESLYNSTDTTTNNNINGVSSNIKLSGSNLSTSSSLISESTSDSTSESGNETNEDMDFLHFKSVSSQPSYEKGGRIEAYSSDSLMMLLRLLPRCDSETLIEDGLSQFMVLVDFHFLHLKHLSHARALEELMEQIIRSPSVLHLPYFRALAQLGTYHVEKKVLSHIFTYALSSADLPVSSGVMVPPQHQWLSLLSYLTRRQAPLHYFHFDDSSTPTSTSTRQAFVRLQPIRDFPDMLHGYTICCWLNASRAGTVRTGTERNGEEEEDADEDDSAARQRDSSLTAGLVSLTCGQIVLFEVYLRTLPRPGTGSLPRLQRVLCVQSQLGPTDPVETFAFDRFSLDDEQESLHDDNKWHFLVITHGRGVISLYVDGTFVQRCDCLKYPRGEELVGYLGCRLQQDFTPHNFFTGGLGTVRIFRGLWTEEDAARVFQLGTISSDLPHTYLSSQLIAIDPRTSRSRLNKIHTIGEGVSQHHTHSVQSLARMEQVLPLLMIGGPQQRAQALTLLASGLIDKNPRSLREFRRLRGFSVAYRLLKGTIVPLSGYESLFRVLQWRIGPGNKDLNYAKDGALLLVLDLLASSPEKLERPVLVGLCEAILHPQGGCGNNSRKWLVNILELLHKLRGSDLHHPILDLIARTLPMFCMKELKAIFGFLFDPKNECENLNPTKLGLLQLLFHLIRGSPNLSNSPLLRLLEEDKEKEKSETCNLLLSLLLNQDERMRVLALQILSVLFSKCSNHEIKKSDVNVHFLLINRLLLNSSRITTRLCLSILELCHGGSRTIPWSMPANLNNSRNRINPEKNIIVHPEGLAALLELMKHSTDLHLHLQVLGEIDRLMDTEENMKVMSLDSWWIWWTPYLYHLHNITFPHSPFDPILQDNVNAQNVNVNVNVNSQAFRGTAKAVGKQMQAILEKLLLFDICRPTVESELPQMKLTGKRSFLVLAANVVMSHFEAFPCLPSDPQQAENIICHLSLLYHDLHSLPTPPTVLQGLLNHINGLVWQNTPFVRRLMKSKGLFDIRDGLIRTLLASDKATTRQFLVTFPFESIANEPSFRASDQGFLQLISLFHDAHSSSDLPLVGLILHILRSVLGSFPENRTVITRVISDQEVSKRLFMDEPHVFVEWYFHVEQSGTRSNLTSRISSALKIPALDHNFQSSTTVFDYRPDPSIEEALEKVESARVEKMKECCLWLENKTRKCQLAREQRWKEGDQIWTKMLTHSTK